MRIVPREDWNSGRLLRHEYCNYCVDIVGSNISGARHPSGNPFQGPWLDANLYYEFL